VRPELDGTWIEAARRPFADVAVGSLVPVVLVGTGADTIS
jgi:hypothetical protein